MSFYMKVEFIKNFISGTIYCFDFWGIKDVRPQKINNRTNLFYIQSMTVIIGVVGDFKGQIIYCFDENLVLEIVLKMCGLGFKSFDE